MDLGSIFSGKVNRKSPIGGTTYGIPESRSRFLGLILKTIMGAFGGAIFGLLWGAIFEALFFF